MKTKINKLLEEIEECKGKYPCTELKARLKERLDCIEDEIEVLKEVYNMFYKIKPKVDTSLYRRHIYERLKKLKEDKLKIKEKVR